jgi:hypothetical protein
VLAGVAAAGALVYASVVVAAGIPARPQVGSAAARAAEHTLPAIEVVQGDGIAEIDSGTAQTIARDIVVGLRTELNALRARDATLAARAATGEWLTTLRGRIHDEASEIAVGHVSVDRVGLRLMLSGDQGPPFVIARLVGTRTTSPVTTNGSTSMSSSGSEPFTRTLVLVLEDGTYRIAHSKGGDRTTSPASTLAIRMRPIGRQSVPQGASLRLRVRARNTGPAGTSLPLVLRIGHEAGPDIAFFRTFVTVLKGGIWSSQVSVTPSQWFRPLGRYRITATVDGIPTGSQLVFMVTRSTLVVPQFEDVTAAAGLETTVPQPACGQFSSGAAWSDVDGDGDLDLFLTRLDEESQLFINDGAGRFDDEASARGVAVRNANGAAFADYDNDGYNDLYVARDGADVLFRNDGTGKFADKSAAAGIAEAFRGTSASWGDFDNDGNVDLYVTNYMRCGNLTTQGGYQWEVEYQPDLLYHNNGDGTFSDWTTLLDRKRTRSENGAGFTAAWFDYNNDDRLDLYLANDDIGLAPDHNRLWQNDGPATGGWRFTDVSTASKSAVLMNTMGIGVGDFDRDLRFDLALSNIGPNRLLRNNKSGSFRDVAGPTGVARPLQRATDESITWGVGFYDFNLDGWEDLYFAAGNIYRERGAPVGVQQAGSKVGVQTNELFVNDHGKRFLDHSAPSGAADPGDSKGVAFADWDRDGRMDFLVVNQGGAPRLYRNITPRRNLHWLEVKPVGATSNRSGCGTRVFLTLAGGAKMVRQVTCGGTSVGSGNQDAVHFGLGSASEVAMLEVLWPSGARTRLRDLNRVDRLLTLREPT